MTISRSDLAEAMELAAQMLRSGRLSPEGAFSQLQRCYEQGSSRAMGDTAANLEPTHWGRYAGGGLFDDPEMLASLKRCGLVA